MKYIYLAGAMEHYFKTNCTFGNEWRKEVKEYFRSNTVDFKCIDPTDYYNFEHNDAKSGKEIMLFDLRKVKQSDVILVDLNQIRHSLGASDEIFYAWSLGIPIIGFVNREFISDKELEQFVHSWKYEQIDRIETGSNALLKACDYIRNYYG